MRVLPCLLACRGLSESEEAVGKRLKTFIMVLHCLLWRGASERIAVLQSK